MVYCSRIALLRVFSRAPKELTDRVQVIKEAGFQPWAKFEDVRGSIETRPDVVAQKYGFGPHALTSSATQILDMCEFLRKLLNADDTSPTAAEDA